MRPLLQNTPARSFSRWVLAVRRRNSVPKEKEKRTSTARVKFDSRQLTTRTHLDSCLSQDKGAKPESLEKRRCSETTSCRTTKAPETPHNISKPQDSTLTLINNIISWPRRKIRGRKPPRRNIRGRMSLSLKNGKNRRFPTTKIFRDVKKL